MAACAACAAVLGAAPAVRPVLLEESAESGGVRCAAAGATETYAPKTKPLSFGVDNIRPIEIPAEDRNRTSPFPYGGARFEFRAVGSSQNVSLVNTVRSRVSRGSAG